MWLCCRIIVWVRVIVRVMVLVWERIRLDFSLWVGCRISVTDRVRVRVRV